MVDTEYEGANKELSEVLKHHGVKGMKWGVRKDRKASKNSIDTKKDRKKTSRNVKQLSDKELITYINRLQNEKKLKSLVKEDISPGKKFVKDLLVTEGKRQATKYINKAAFSVIRLAFDDNFSSYDFAASLLPFAPDPRSKSNTSNKRPSAPGSRSKNGINSGLTRLETEINKPGWKPKGKTTY